MELINFLAIGDKSAGSKEFMLSAQSNHALYPPHQLTKKAFQDKIAWVMVADQSYVKLQVWDAAGDTQYHKLLLLPHFEVDVCAIFLSVMNQHSFQNALFKWYEDIKAFGKNIDIIFIGTHTEERQKLQKEMKEQNRSINQGPICKQVATQLIEGSLGCTYLECNCKSKEGVRQIYEAAVRLVMQRKQVKLHKLQQQTKCECKLI